MPSFSDHRKGSSPPPPPPPYLHLNPSKHRTAARFSLLFFIIFLFSWRVFGSGPQPFFFTGMNPSENEFFFPQNFNWKAHPSIVPFQILIMLGSGATSSDHYISNYGSTGLLYFLYYNIYYYYYFPSCVLHPTKRNLIFSC